MAERTLRPTKKALKAARLLPTNEPEHHIAKGQEVPPQPGPVAHAFGPPQVVGDRTLIPVASVQYVSGRGFRGKRTPKGETKDRQSVARFARNGGTFTRRTPVAIVEVSDNGVRVHAMPTPGSVIFAGILLVAWNVYWVMRTVREWRASSRLG